MKSPAPPARFTGNSTITRFGGTGDGDGDDGGPGEGGDNGSGDGADETNARTPSTA